MRDDEPLEGWLFLAKVRAERGPTPHQQRAGGAALSQLARALAAQPEGEVNYDRLPDALGTYDRVALSEAETAEAQRLFLAVWERGGPGMRYVSDGLLENVALALQPAAVPFWRQVLDLSRPRDRTATRRRTLALAALALLAVVREDAAAYEALAEALAHPHEQVRALGAFYLARSYAIPGGPCLRSSRRSSRSWRPATQPSPHASRPASRCGLWAARPPMMIPRTSTCSRCCSAAPASPAPSSSAPSRPWRICTMPSRAPSAGTPTTSTASL